MQERTNFETIPAVEVRNPNLLGAQHRANSIAVLPEPSLDQKFEWFDAADKQLADAISQLEAYANEGHTEKPADKSEIIDTTTMTLGVVSVETPDVTASAPQYYVERGRHRKARESLRTRVSRSLGSVAARIFAPFVSRT